MSFRVSALCDRLAFGAVVTDLDVGSLGDGAVRAALVDLWVDRGVIVFRGMDVGEDGHVALSSVFGTPEVHPLRDPSKPGRPELSDIRFDDTFGDVYRFADGTERGGWLPWHFDLVYVDRINHGGILRPLVLPEEGGDTGFIDQIEAYERLPRELKERIADLEVVYSFEYDASGQRFGATAGIEMVRMDPRARKLMARPGGHPEVVHPMVFRQPTTGRKVLNVSPWFALRIDGLGRDENDALLEEVVTHVVDERRAYFHHYAPDDLVLWDNWRTMHCAPGIPSGDRRHMQRTTIAGDYGQGRLRDRSATIDEAIRVNV